MRNVLSLFLLTILLAGCSTTPEPATKLERANVLPLALDQNFQFRKAKLYYNQPAAKMAPSTSEVVNFERQRMNFGAITSFDLVQRYGNYYDFFWRTSETADVTVRFEYRQTATANYVMAMERYYPGAHGSFKSEFAVNGDDYLEQGAVTAWRVVLIVQGRIVALRQSFMWR